MTIKIRTKDELLKFAKSHPTWLLYVAQGTSASDDFWWMVSPRNRSIVVDGRAISSKLLRESFEVARRDYFRLKKAS